MKISKSFSSPWLLSIFTVKMPKSKALKKKLKFMEQSFGGSTDSQISNGESSSPISLQKINAIDTEELQLLKSKLYDSEKVCYVERFLSMTFILQSLTAMQQSV